jgi:hypothetical protein
MTPRMGRATLLVTVVLSGCASSRASEPRALPESRSEGASPAEDRCAAATASERVEVALGATVVAPSGIAVTYRGSSHDSYDDGRSDVLLELVFQGVLEDGTLSPSALTWMPSALAAPEWHYLPVGRCARVAQAGDQRVVVELFRP